jgi:integrase
MNGLAFYTDSEGNELPLQQYNEKGLPVDVNGRVYSRTNKKPKTTKHYKGLKFHELRHTHATLLIANNVDIKTAQNRLGHAKAATTIDFYAHAQKDRDRMATALFSSLLTTRQSEAKVVNF